MKITPQKLQALGACAHQLAIFAAEWPKGCDVTKANALRAVELKLGFGWLAENILPAPAREEYEKTEAPAWAEYLKDEALAWTEYRKGISLARAKYDKSRALAFVRIYNI